MERFPCQIFDKQNGRTAVIKSYSCKNSARQEGTPSALLRFSITTVLSYDEVEHVPLARSAVAARDHVIEAAEASGAPVASTVVLRGPFPLMTYIMDHPSEDVQARFEADIVGDLKVATDHRGQSSMTWTVEGWMSCKYIGKLSFMIGNTNACLLRVISK